MLTTPQWIVDTFKDGMRYLTSLGRNGLFNQNRINERFFVGDQWQGAFCGSERPLVCHNVIKRIGEYKMGSLMKDEVQLDFSACGVEKTFSGKKRVGEIKQAMLNGEKADRIANDDKVNLLTEMLSLHFKTTARKLRLKELFSVVLRDAFISGSGILYSYFDENSNSIKCEVLSVENVCFGDYTAEQIEEQPFIIIKSARSAEWIKTRNIKVQASGETAVYTMLYKKQTESGKQVFATVVTEKGVICPPYCTNLSRYPLAVFCWQSRKNRVLGESEVTHLVPNQVAINRLLTVSSWSAMSMGMPLMLVNGDSVPDSISQDPGQIIKVYGSNEDVAGAVHFVTPPDFSNNFQNSVNDLVAATIESSGAAELLPEKISYSNTAAVNAMSGLFDIGKISLKNRYLCFFEDVALIFIDFFKNKYGKRNIAVESGGAVIYLPFDSNDIKKLDISVKAEYKEETEYDGK